MTYAAVIAVLAAVAAIACLVPARRAAAIDPMRRCARIDGLVRGVAVRRHYSRVVDASDANAIRTNQAKNGP